MKRYLLTLVFLMASAVVDAAPNGSADEISKATQLQIKEFTGKDWTLATLSGARLGIHLFGDSTL